MRIRTIAATLVVSSLLCSAPAMAQQRHVVDPGAMQQAIAAQSQTDQQNRNAVLGVLQHSQVREVADRLGLSVTQAEHAVSTLGGPELANLAASARTVDAQLAGGNSVVVVSITTILLIIIIIILLAD